MAPYLETTPVTLHPPQLDALPTSPSPDQLSVKISNSSGHSPPPSPGYDLTTLATPPASLPLYPAVMVQYAAQAQIGHAVPSPPHALPTTSTSTVPTPPITNTPVGTPSPTQTLSQLPPSPPPRFIQPTPTIHYVQYGEGAYAAPAQLMLSCGQPHSPHCPCPDCCYTRYQYQFLYFAQLQMLNDTSSMCPKTAMQQQPPLHQPDIPIQVLQYGLNVSNQNVSYDPNITNQNVPHDPNDSNQNVPHDPNITIQNEPYIPNDPAQIVPCEPNWSPKLLTHESHQDEESRICCEQYSESLTTRMEIVWHGEFDNLFRSFGQQWHLVPTIEPPEQSQTCLPSVNIPVNQVRWKTFRDSAKVRFACDTCGNGWTSMKGRVISWYCLLPEYNTGYVLFKLFGQQCKKCSTGVFEHAMWYPDEVVKVVSNLFQRIGQSYYGFTAPSLRHHRRDGKPKEQHNAQLCQACHDGCCKEELMFT